MVARRSRSQALLAAASVWLALTAAPGAVRAQGFETEAKFALLLDAATDMPLFAKEAEASFPPASFAKLMTLAVVFDEIRANRLTLDRLFHVSENAWRTGGGPARVSAMFVKVNSYVPVRDLIHGVTVAIGNDAAIALAEGIAGSEKAFAEKMNARAKEIGLTNSHFVNATGLPAEGQRTTAQDLARLSRYLITSHPELYKAFAHAEVEASNIKQRNRNPLIGTYRGADGLMLGAVAELGSGVVASAERDGKRLIAVVMGVPDEDDRIPAVKSLMDLGYSGFGERELYAAGVEISSAKVFGGTLGSVGLVADGPVRVSVPKKSPGKITARVSYQGPLKAPISKGQRVATLAIWRDGLLQRRVPLVAAQDVPQGSLWRRAFDGSYELAVSAVRLATQKR